MTVTIDGTTGIDKVQDGSIVYADLDSNIPLGTKNLIINGDMRIAQRGTSLTGLTSGNNYTSDRFQFQVGAGTWSQTTDTNVPTGQGFVNSLKINCTASATPTGAQQVNISHIIEAQNLQHLKYGTSNAESITLSFWVKSNKTGTYAIWFYQSDDARQTNKTYTIDTADTWEKKTITISGDTVGIIDNDNGAGLYVRWVLASGPDFTSGTSPNGTWEAYTTANAYVGQAVNLADSTSNYINITGVQLELGENATPFEHRPYDMELAMCQRYYQVIEAGVNAYSSTGITGFPFNTAMRATPTLTFSYSGTANRVYRIDTGGTSDLTVAATALTDKFFISLFATSPAGWASAAGIGFRSIFVFSAEL